MFKAESAPTAVDVDSNDYVLDTDTSNSDASSTFHNILCDYASAVILMLLLLKLLVILLQLYKF